MENYTRSQLFKLCKSKGIGTNQRMRKAKLYNLCFENPNTCKNVKSAKNASKCIKYLNEKYPKIVYKTCHPIVNGPASALIESNKKIIGIVSPRGIVKPLDCNIPVPPPQPIPIIKAGVTLKRELSKKKGDNVVISYDRIVDQIAEGRFNLRKVTKKDIDNYKSMRDFECQMARSKTLLGEIENRKCKSNFVWNNKLKRCVPVKEGISPEKVEKLVVEYYEL